MLAVDGAGDVGALHLNLGLSPLTTLESVPRSAVISAGFPPSVVPLQVMTMRVSDVSSLEHDKFPLMGVSGVLEGDLPGLGGPGAGDSPADEVFRPAPGQCGGGHRAREAQRDARAACR
ncbi:hypothetical protein [Streptomyces sp. NPDC051218]|uniref:hypothetical protein n=1 Tax=Streptomyces sp. NPDC051218 TaxID=3365645 RepID=UPI0037ADC219